MGVFSPEGDLPELSALFGPPRKHSSILPSNLRRSPRKKLETAGYQEMDPKNDVDLLMAASSQTQRSPAKISQIKDKTTTDPSHARPATMLRHTPFLPRGRSEVTTTATSNNRSSPKSQYKPAHLPQVDSLLLPLSLLAVQEKTQQARKQSRVGSTKIVPSSQKSMMAMMTDAARDSTARKSPPKPQPKPKGASTSRYILNEARCNDDEDESGKDEEDDEETDLSGFIVDDDAELSYHESAGSESEDEGARRSRRGQRSPRRRLHRGPRQRTSSRVECVDLTNTDDGVSSALQHMTIEAPKSEHMVIREVEIIDLTSSPVKPDHGDFDYNSQLGNPSVDQANKSVSRNLFDDFNRILRLSPPKHKNVIPVPEKLKTQEFERLDQNDTHEPLAEDKGMVYSNKDRYTTPPGTPPRSPSKLKSPSKLLSPSKDDTKSRSQHRQSTDAFWDLNIVNEWHDVNSPKKAPATSPRKKGIARFNIWSDDSDDETSRISDDSLPSPCESPTKPRSPLKSPEKAEKRRIAEEKRADKVKKAAFDSSKIGLARDLLDELDANITDGKLGKLAASTGGLNINWSKTLRSTAGRANWRRTVTKNSGSPIKGDISEGPGVKIEHFADIELAEKVIDCEERLVNTLAHEFCHLANFMVSNIRDQPHGASFKSWAAKATRHLKKSDNELWKKVEVTTKHNYAINHKYMWVCVGRDRTKAIEFLNLTEDEGCGAEYGRHSKSIDPEKSRCGRCKGKLIQIRPKPRMSPVKKVEKMMEVVELSN